MRGKLKRYLTEFIMITILISSTSSFASGVQNSNQFLGTSINIKVNGVLVNSPNLIYNGRTYVQLISLCEKLGMNLSWDAKTNTANISSSGVYGNGKPLPNLIYYQGPATYPKEVALTFDDGPDTNYTPQILDILKENNVKATFFIMGAKAKEYPEMVRKIAAEGHAIGNHSWDHPLLTKLTPEQIKSEVDKSELTLYSILGYYPLIFRLPYGASTPSNIDEIYSIGYKVINWSVDTRDWAGTPVPTILNEVKDELRPGGIILEHCAIGKGGDLSNTVKALPQIITMLKSQGYEFLTVPELLNIPAYRKEIKG